MESQSVSRRDFLRSGAAVAAAATVTPTSAFAQDNKGKQESSLVPKRPLGKSGVDVSMLALGFSRNTESRFLNAVKQSGIRYIDTADCYLHGRHQKEVGAWLQNEKRQDWFLVSKDHPRSPKQWIEMLDQRLEDAQTDYLDLYFIHCFGDSEYYDYDFKNWPADKEWAKAADKIKKSGKAKLVGFSSHCQPVDLRSELLETAARGGWVDAIMVATDPGLVKKNTRFNKALDACHKSGIGLISMKECKTGPDAVKGVVPEFEAMDLTVYAAILTAVWTDERFASICSAIDNLKKLRENVATAKNFKPFTKEQLATTVGVIDGLARSYCPGCTGDCQEAGETTADLNSIARYLTYYQQMGDHEEARRLFAALPPEARDLASIDVQAASKACTSNLDFARIVRHAKAKLA